MQLDAKRLFALLLLAAASSGIILEHGDRVTCGGLQHVCDAQESIMYHDSSKAPPAAPVTRDSAKAKEVPFSSAKDSAHYKLPVVSTAKEPSPSAVNLGFLQNPRLEERDLFLAASELAELVDASRPDGEDVRPLAIVALGRRESMAIKLSEILGDYITLGIVLDSFSESSVETLATIRNSFSDKKWRGAHLNGPSLIELDDKREVAAISADIGLVADHLLELVPDPDALLDFLAGPVLQLGRIVLGFVPVQEGKPRDPAFRRQWTTEQLMDYIESHGKFQVIPSRQFTQKLQPDYSWLVLAKKDKDYYMLGVSLKFHQQT